jgi:hypothetical protein
MAEGKESKRQTKRRQIYFYDNEPIIRASIPS